MRLRRLRVAVRCLGQALFLAVPRLRSLRRRPPTAGNLRDDALDVGMLLAVVLAQGKLGGPVRLGDAQQHVVLVQDQVAAVLVRVAAGGRGRRRRRSRYGGR
jgi:hypothetical protein